MRRKGPTFTQVICLVPVILLTLSLFICGILIFRQASSLKHSALQADCSSYSTLLDYSICASLEYLFKDTINPKVFSFLYHPVHREHYDGITSAYPPLVPFALSWIELKGSLPAMRYPLSLGTAYILSFTEKSMNGYMCILQQNLIFGSARGTSAAAYLYYDSSPMSLPLDQMVRLAAMIGMEDSSPDSRNRDFIRKCNYILSYLEKRELISTQDYELTAEYLK